MKKLVIYGTGKIAEVLSYYLTNESEYKIVAYCEHKEYMRQDSFLSLPIISFEDLQEKYPPKDCYVFVAIGYKAHNEVRENRFDLLKKSGYQFINFISTKSSYYGSPIGDNSFVFEENVIQPFTEIGDNTIIWSGNHIGHHTKIGKNCFLSSHVVISGNCTIENNCFLGVNATIGDGVTIGARSVIGAGAIVLKNVPPNSLVVPEKSTTVELRRNII